MLIKKRLPDGSLGNPVEAFPNSPKSLTVKELQGQLLELQEYIINKELEDMLQKGGVL